MKKYSPEHIQISDSVIAYLENNTVLSKNKIEQILSIHQGKLSNKVLSDRFLFRLIGYLGQYGFKLNGYSIEIDLETNFLFLSKNIGEPKHIDNALHNQTIEKVIVCDYGDLYDFVKSV